jgi:hypothetical protein
VFEPNPATNSVVPIVASDVLKKKRKRKKGRKERGGL